MITKKFITLALAFSTILLAAPGFASQSEICDRSGAKITFDLAHKSVSMGNSKVAFDSAKKMQKNDLLNPNILALAETNLSDGTAYSGKNGSFVMYNVTGKQQNYLVIVVPRETWSLIGSTSLCTATK